MRASHATSRRVSLVSSLRTTLPGKIISHVGHYWSAPCLWPMVNSPRNVSFGDILGRRHLSFFIKSFNKFPYRKRLYSPIILCNIFQVGYIFNKRDFQTDDIFKCHFQTEICRDYGTPLLAFSLRIKKRNKMLKKR